MVCTINLQLLSCFHFELSGQQVPLLSFLFPEHLLHSFLNNGESYDLNPSFSSPAIAARFQRISLKNAVVTPPTSCRRRRSNRRSPRMVVQRALLPINALRRRSLVQRESLLRHVGPQAQSEKKEETSAAAAAPDNMILFHSSGLTCNQWRKLKNLWHPGRTLFRPQPSSSPSPSPSSSGTGENGKGTKPFFDNLAHSTGPTCILYSAQEKLNNLPDPTDQDLLMLYGEHRSTLVDHMDVERATSIVGSDDSSVFHSYLPGLHLQLVIDLSCGSGPLQSQGDGSS